MTSQGSDAPRQSAGPRWGIIAPLTILLVGVVAATIFLIASDYRAPWLLVAGLIIGVPLVILILIELTTTTVNQLRLRTLGQLARSLSSQEHWIVVEDWWDTESLLRLKATSTGRPVFHLFVFATSIGLEVWQGGTRLTTIEWSRIREVRAGWRKRLTGFEKLQQADETLRKWGARDSDQQLQSLRGEAKMGSVEVPILELFLKDMDTPVAFSVTGRNPLGSRRLAHRRVTEVVDAVGELLETNRSE